MFTQIQNMGIKQEELQKELTSKVDQCSKDQQFIVKQVQANGQAVAALTLKQFEDEDMSDSGSSQSTAFDDEDNPFCNNFAKSKSSKRELSSHHKYKRYKSKHESVPKHLLPKLHFSTFDGYDTKIWIDDCLS